MSNFKVFIGDNDNHAKYVGQILDDITLTQLNNKQDALISGTNIKTVNGTSILGSGNLAISEVASQSSGTIKFWTGTQTQYDAIITKDATTLYIIIPAS